jgi:glycine/D-amino acid oxidase-like deaminating enzyme
MAHLARGAVEMLPALRGGNFLRTWAGTLEMTPDKIPIIGPVEGIEGYILASGFSGHGFCLGPIAGKLLSEQIADGEPSLLLHKFRLSCFAEPAALRRRLKRRDQRHPPQADWCVMVAGLRANSNRDSTGGMR